MGRRSRSPRCVRASRGYRLVSILCALAALIFGVSVAAGDVVEERFRATERRPVVMAGRMLVLPLSVIDQQASVSGFPRRLPVELGDGSRLEGDVVWMSRRSVETPHAWAPVAARWSIGPTVEPDAELALPLLAVSMPDRVPDTPMLVGGDRVRPIVIEETGRLWQLDLESAQRSSEDLLAIVMPIADDPTQFWRAALMADRLGVVGRWPAFEDPFSHALAHQEAARWRAALDELAALDVDLARRTRARLTATCTIGGRGVPAWPVDARMLSELRQVLLEPSLTGEQRLVRVQSWLSSQPKVLAWPVYDGVRATMTVGVANLTDTEIPIIARWDRNEPFPDVRRLPGGASIVFDVYRPAGASTGAGVLRLEFGDAHEPVHIPVPPALIGCEPPGAVVGPLAAMLVQRDWIAGRLQRLPDTRATRGLVRQTEAGWELYIECRRGEAGPGPSRMTNPARSHASRLTAESIYIFVGPYEDPRALIGVDPMGDVVSYRGRLDGARPPSVTTSGDVWTATIPIADAWIESGQVLRLGLVRSFGSGEAPASWPMPVLPWRVEPGRVSFDLSAWDADDRPSLERLRSDSPLPGIPTGGS
jgi:hypothetical protein